MVSKKESIVLGAALLGGAGLGLMVLKGKEDEENGGDAAGSRPSWWDDFVDLFTTPPGVPKDPDVPKDPGVPPTEYLPESHPAERYITDPRYLGTIVHSPTSREIVIGESSPTGISPGAYPHVKKYTSDPRHIETVGKEIIIGSSGVTRGASSGGGGIASSKAVSTSKKSTYVRRSKIGYKYSGGKLVPK